MSLRRWTAALVVVATGALAACGDDGGSDPADAIEGFDTSAEAGFGPRARLNLALAAQPEASREAALENLESDDADVRIAAIYALSVTLEPTDADVLEPLLESPDLAQRVLAAAALLSLEDGRAVPVLIETLDDDVAIPFGSPPARVWQKARFALLQFTGQDFGLSEANTIEEAAATVPEWEAWWADAQESFEIVRVPDPLEP